MSECSAPSLVKRESKLFFLNPASNWNEALPFGNGRFGGMFFGDPCKELILLNEESVWTHGHSLQDMKDGTSHLPEIREALFNGETAILNNKLEQI